MTIYFISQFKRDYKKIKKRNKDLKKLKIIIEKLEPKYRDHQLIGEFKSYRNCHIEPDWLIIYKKTSDIIIFERTGSHSELFTK